MKVFISIFVVVLAVVGLGYFLFQSSAEPADPNEGPGEFFVEQGAEHIAEGTTEHPPYSSNPPTSGWHWPSPAAWGVYKSALPDERFVHNLEHGGIWISYKPSVDAETIAKLEDFAQRYRKVIVAPREANDSNIALAAWEYLEKMDVYDENTILNFIEAYYDEGPEKVP
ncbi:MAG TPA: DUF3105 domain-containing protein [Candidatus Binatia bacterium]|nr:DUF3105 domain-containing protein [Candidatus Binatia bacterium]